MAKFKFGSKDPSAGGTKSRAVIFFVAVILITGAIIGYLIYRRHTQGVANVASLSGTPGIESIPGVGTTSTEYVKLQEQQNIQQAQQAEQQGTSAVPTITRTSYFGPTEFPSSGATKPGCTPEELRRARAAGVTVDELKCKGCTLAELRAAGYTVGELGNAGFNPQNLKNAGFSANQLRQAGFNPTELRQAGFTPNQLAGAGFTPASLAQAGVSPDELKNAGFAPAALASAGIGIPTPSNLPRDCSIAALRQAHAQGVPAAALKKMGCGAAALRAAGYTAADLRAAGFTPEELKAAGFSAPDLRTAGYTAGQLGRAGYSPTDLKNAGFTPADLRNAGASPQALRNAGFNPNDLKNAGFTEGDLVRGGFAPTGAVAALPPRLDDCSIESLRQARAQGVSAADIKRRGCSEAALLAAGYTPAELRATGSSDAALRAAGLTPAQIATSQPGIAGSAVIPPVGNTEIQLAQLQANQEQQLNDQQRQQRMAQVQSSMVSQANSLFSTWTPPAPQEYVAGEPPKESRPQGQTPGSPTPGGLTTTVTTTTAPPPGATGQPPVTSAAAAGNADTPCAYVKGGDIMMGVLTSTVNSDENSPVMATIVSGKLKGAKLIGQFTLLKKKVLINFNKMNMPGKPASIGINAVAIDPCTAHTALADCVDNHYLLRYGTLFASSFLSGLADAIAQQGSQTSIGTGGILVTHDPLSTGQTIAVALGAVGSQYASVLGSNFTRPPTVMVYEGDSIGILFMQDLTDIPDKCCPDIDKTCNTAGAGACKVAY